MREKRVSSDEQFRLIMECRQSSLSDYQWCQANDINPGTFYNWISRLRRKGMVIPGSVATTEPTAAELQEVVKVELIPDYGLNLYEYLKYLLEHRPRKDMSDEELSRLAPWSETVKEHCKNKAE